MQHQKVCTNLFPASKLNSMAPRHRIEGSSSNNTTKALSIGGFGLVEVDAPGDVGGRFSINNSGNVKCKGTLTSGGNITCPAITCSSSSTALYVSGGGNAIFSGKIGVLNLFPQSMLHLGNCESVGSAPVIIFGKNTGGGNRNAFMGYTDSFFFVIGDYGNTNGTNTLTQQLAILYSAPLSLVIGASGYVTMQYGYGGASDERIKTNIKLLRMH